MHRRDDRLREFRLEDLAEVLSHAELPASSA